MNDKKSWANGISIFANLSQILAFLLILFDTQGYSSKTLVLALISATFIGLITALWANVQPSTLHYSQQKNEKSTKIIILSILFVFFLSIIFLITRKTSDTLKIVILNFSENGTPNSADWSHSQLLVENLEQSLPANQNIEIFPIFDFEGEINSQKAREIGKSHNATIVIWGWYTTDDDTVLFFPHFEILTEQTIYLPFNFQERVVERHNFENVDFKINLSDDYLYLSTYTLATIRYSQGRYPEAIEIYSKSIESAKTEENMASAYNMRGLAHSYFGESKKALADYIEATKLAPSDYIYYYNLGVKLHDLGRVEEALAILEKSKDLDPNFSSPWNSLALIHHQLGNFSTAEEYYKKAIELDTTEIIFRENLITLYVEVGKFDNALYEISISLQKAPKNWYIHFLKSQILFTQGQKTSAFFEGILSIFYLSPLSFSFVILIVIFLVVLYVANKRNDNKIIEWLFLQIIGVISFIILLLFRFKHKNYHHDSKSIIKKILAFGILLKLTTFIIKNDKLNAKSIAKSAISRGIQNTILLETLGNFYFTESEYDTAAKIYRDILKTRSSNGCANYGLGIIYKEKGDFAKALLKLQSIINSPEYEVLAWLLAGDIYWEKYKNFRGALISWNRATKTNPNHVIREARQKTSGILAWRSPKEHFKLGLAYAQLNDIKNAKFSFDMAVKQTPYSSIGKYANMRFKKLDIM